MYERIVLTEEGLRKVLARVTFAPSCVDMDWRWQVEPICKPSTPPVATPAPSNYDEHPFLRCTKIDGGFACTRPPEEDQ